MTCEDCIHYEACHRKGNEIPAEHCRIFKDKADFAEVVHGEWIAEYEREGNYSYCSICECRCRGYVPNYKYCPNCGAKMEEVRSDGKVC